MKKQNAFLLMVLMICLMAVSADATLYDRGGGLIYDDGNNITWLQDANTAETSGWDADGTMNWTTALNWINYLNDNNYLGYNDWRQPIAPIYENNSYCYNFGCNDSEMGHLYYTELGNASWDIPGCTPGVDCGLVNTGPFMNLLTDKPYWTGTTTPTNGAMKIYFSFLNGGQGTWEGGNTYNVWAVRDGDSSPVVPEPISSLLFVTGGTLLACRRFFFPNEDD